MGTSPRHQGHAPEWADANCRAVLEAAPDAMLVVNRAGEIVAANVQAQKLYGYSREHLIGSVVESVIPARLRERHRQHRENFQANPEMQAMQVLEIFAVRSDASEIPVDVSLSQLTIGSETFAISASRDATERRRAEELKTTEAILRRSENRFRLVADTAPVLIWMSGTDKLCTYFNKPWLEFTGRSMEQELGNGWAEGVHPEDLQRCLDTYTQSFDRRKKFRMEYRLRHQDGEFRWILDIGVPRFDEDRLFAGYIGIGVDVTDRRVAELAVGESEERLRLAAQLGRMFAYSWDAATDVIERSGESAEILGVKKEEAATGAAVSGMVHPDDKERLESAFANLTVEKPTLQVTYRIVRPDGVVKWLERNSRAYFDGNGTVKRMVGMVVDVTERKQAEQSLADMTRKLIEAQEQERARIGRELHDDINQRLAMLALELEQLQNDPSDLQNHLQELRKRTTEISNDVQALSHDLHSSKLEYLGVVAGIRSWCKEFAERQKIEIDFRSDVQSVLPLEVGRTLFRVLQEALQNSIKHSGVKRIEVQLRVDSGEIHLVISDLGRGFDLETATQGRGLGLTSMQERVRLVNGIVEIQSKPMGGTSVHVRVLLSSENTPQRSAG